MSGRTKNGWIAKKVERAIGLGMKKPTECEAKKNKTRNKLFEKKMDGRMEMDVGRKK